MAQPEAKKEKLVTAGSRVWPAYLLMIDAGVDLLLGIGLLLFPEGLVEMVGLPDPGLGFWSSILGAVLLGIGIALLIEVLRDPSRPAGLGHSGAVAINLCGALVLAGWLLGGELELTMQGNLILWGLVLVLGGVSAGEIIGTRRVE
jgi:hypothetical protein